jgi:hypothetical protein
LALYNYSPFDFIKGGCMYSVPLSLKVSEIKWTVIIKGGCMYSVPLSLKVSEIKWTVIIKGQKILFSKILMFLFFIPIYSKTCPNQTDLTPIYSKTCPNQTDLTVPSTKCLCNLYLCKPNNCLNWINSSAPKGFSLDRFYCIYTCTS